MVLEHFGFCDIFKNASAIVFKCLLIIYQYNSEVTIYTYFYMLFNLNKSVLFSQLLTLNEFLRKMSLNRLTQPGILNPTCIFELPGEL